MVTIKQRIGFRYLIAIVLLFSLLCCISIIKSPSSTCYGSGAKGSTSNFKPIPLKENSANLPAVRRLGKALEELNGNANFCSRRDILEQRLKNQGLSAQTFIYNDNAGVFMCYVPKVDCTRWKQAFYWMEYPRKKIPGAIQIHPIVQHDPNVRVDLLAYNDRFSRWSQYKRLMITRHPFERLVSAYKDKFEHQIRERWIACSLMKSFESAGRTREAASVMVARKLSFSTFIDGILAGEPHKQDVHWRAQFLLCDPCALDYDIISHYEDRDKTYPTILKELFGNNSFPVVFKQFISNGTVKQQQEQQQPKFASNSLFKTPSNTKLEALKPYFMQLNAQKRQDLLERYQIDFEAFGYEIPDWF